jgi:hypothetical protein
METHASGRDQGLIDSAIQRHVGVRVHGLLAQPQVLILINEQVSPYDKARQAVDVDGDEQRTGREEAAESAVGAQNEEVRLAPEHDSRFNHIPRRSLLASGDRHTPENLGVQRVAEPLQQVWQPAGRQRVLSDD